MYKLFLFKKSSINKSFNENQDIKEFDKQEQTSGKVSKETIYRRNKNGQET